MIYNQKYEVVREFDAFTFEGQSIDQVGSYKYLWLLLLTWFNFNPSMDK